MQLQDGALQFQGCQPQQKAALPLSLPAARRWWLPQWPQYSRDRLRSAVIASLRSHLFAMPVAADASDKAPPRLNGLMNQVGKELRARASQGPNPRPVLQQQLDDLQEQVNGWTQSLGKRDLHHSLRQRLEAQFTEAAEKEANIQRALDRLNRSAEQIEQVLDANVAIERLRRLDQVLGNGNVSAGNLELSLHIDRINVSADGQIVRRTSKLGIFEGAIQLLARPPPRMRCRRPRLWSTRSNRGGRASCGWTTRIAPSQGTHSIRRTQWTWDALGSSRSAAIASNP